jgi:hypothetical protein
LKPTGCGRVDESTTREDLTEVDEFSIEESWIQKDR